MELVVPDEVRRKDRTLKGGPETLNRTLILEAGVASKWAEEQAPHCIRHTERKQ
jgi:hypothetical protein